MLHLHDGLLQNERERQQLYEELFEGFPHPWADPIMQICLFGSDAREDVDRAWDRYLAGRIPQTTGAWKAAFDAGL
jgi:salicylate hydroxylase